MCIRDSGQCDRIRPVIRVSGRPHRGLRLARRTRHAARHAPSSPSLRHAPGQPSRSTPEQPSRSPSRPSRTRAVTIARPSTGGRQAGSAPLKRSYQVLRMVQTPRRSRVRSILLVRHFYGAARRRGRGVGRDVRTGATSQTPPSCLFARHRVSADTEEVTA